MLWITLLSSTLGEHQEHVEVIPEMFSLSMGDVSEKAAVSLFADLSQPNCTVIPAPGEENTPS